MANTWRFIAGGIWAKRAGTSPEALIAAFTKEKFIGLGWDNLGSLADFHTKYGMMPSPSSIYHELKHEYPDINPASCNDGADSLYHFFYSMKPGDRILIASGGEQPKDWWDAGVAIIAEDGDYMYDTRSLLPVKGYYHRRKIELIHMDPREIRRNFTRQPDFGQRYAIWKMIPKWAI